MTATASEAAPAAITPLQIVQFTHFERTLRVFPGSQDPGRWAGLLGLTPEQYDGLLAECRRHAQELGRLLLQDEAARRDLRRLAALGDRPLIALGSSITADRCGWFELLRSVAGRDIAQRMRNAGGTGDTTVHALSRLQTDVLQHDPGVTVVALGVNDARRHGPPPGTALSTLAGYRERMAAIVTAITQSGSRCVLVTPTPVTEVAEQARDGQCWTRQGLAERTEVVRELAADHALPLADAYAAFTSAPDLESLYLPDGLHPGPRGQLLLAQTILPRIAEALA